MVLALAFGLALGVRYGPRLTSARGLGLNKLVDGESATASAVDDSLAKIARQPNIASHWAAVADAFRAEGKLPGAEAAFRAAVELDPKEPEYRAQLGYTLLERGRDLEAWAMLEEARARGAKGAMLAFTLQSLSARIDTSGAFPRFVVPPRTPTTSSRPPTAAAPKIALKSAPETGADAEETLPAPTPDAIASAPPRVVEEPEPEPESEPEPEPERAAPPRPASLAREPQGPCEIAAIPRRGRGTYLVNILIDGVETSLILDTGATLTVISSELAELANIRPEPGHEIGARTAAGFVRFETGVASTIEIGGRVVENTRVALCDECANAEAAGLLGLDVQRPLGMALDVRRNIVTFSDCEP